MLIIDRLISVAFEGEKNWNLGHSRDFTETQTSALADTPCVDFSIAGHGE